MVRKTHYHELQRFKNLLIRVQLDMTLFPDEATSERRLGRLRGYETDIKDFGDESDELFRKISAYDLTEPA